MLEVEDKVRALEFDVACSLRLLEYDNEKERDRFTTLAAMLGAKIGDGNDADTKVTVV